MRFTIKRSKWLRGTGKGKLLNADGMQCCIGQACSALGVPDKAMLDIGVVRSIRGGPDRLGPLFDYTRMDEVEWVGRAYSVNDDEEIRDDEREARLSHLAAANGHEFVFVD